MAQATEKITYTATPEQIERMHASFDDALELAKTKLGQTFPMIINGESVSAPKTFAPSSPVDRSVVLGNFQSGSRSDVDSAVAAARSAYPSWSGRPWAERVTILRAAAELIRERKFLISAYLIVECGKNRAEAIGEVEEGADLIDEYCRQVEDSNGFRRSMGSIDPREHNQSILRPFGVWAVLAPFNFPFALSTGMSSGALVAGNTVVFKPASATPLSGYEMARCFIDAGIPAGVFNFITGSGSRGRRVAGACIVDVDGVIFTGSKEVGLDLFKRFSTEFPKPCITEMGGKNPTIVTRNADLDKAVDGVARSAFGFSGQKCSACFTRVC